MLHDQVSTYQTRLNNGLDKPGLSQRMTARLYPMAWARGYAQYGGAGIENVSQTGTSRWRRTAHARRPAVDLRPE